tara:strand:+ start:272 stop:637 length:366 start_codon:yes stop_codon:yes gene_type:complete
MKKLLITLLLISPFSFADWGDVYYCQMTTYSEVTLEGKKTDYILQKFQFKLDRIKNAMVFGNSGVFNNMEMELEEGGSVPSNEEWWANNSISKSYFKDGKFLFASVAYDFASYISADCDKF